jgi:hypothetical protein
MRHWTTGLMEMLYQVNKPSYFSFGATFLSLLMFYLSTMVLPLHFYFPDPNYEGDAGEFKRSASARLHRNKRNYPDIFGEQGFVAASGVPSHSGNIPEDNGRKQQVMILI